MPPGDKAADPDPRDQLQAGDAIEHQDEQGGKAM